MRMDVLRYFRNSSNDHKPAPTLWTRLCKWSRDWRPLPFCRQHYFRWLLEFRQIQNVDSLALFKRLHCYIASRRCTIGRKCENDRIILAISRGIISFFSLQGYYLFADRIQRCVLLRVSICTQSSVTFFYSLHKIKRSMLSFLWYPLHYAAINIIIQKIVLVK